MIDDNLRNHFVNLFSVAIVDNEMDPTELNLLYELGIEKGINKEQIDEVIANPHKARFIKPNSLIEAIDQLYDLTNMVIVDGRIHPSQLALCKSFAKKFDIHESIIDELIEKLIDEIKSGIDKKTLMKDIIKSI